MVGQAVPNQLHDFTDCHGIKLVVQSRGSLTGLIRELDDITWIILQDAVERSNR